MEWGIAEEAGRAARWLAARGFLPVLSPLLTARENICPPDENAIGGGKLIPAKHRGVLCPLTIGAYLSDCGRRGLPKRCERVARPLLLLPFAARLSEKRRLVVLEWRGAECIVGGGNVWLPKTSNLSAAVASPEIRLLAAAPSRPPDAAAKAEGGGRFSPQEWRRLKTLAAKTFVPDSDHSRQFGAGATDD